MAGRIPKVVVLGPCYVDMAIKCQSFPGAGNVVEGVGFSCQPAGPGPNRAIAAAICQCETYIIGKVGDDMPGKMIVDNLSKHHVNTEFIYTAQAMSTGVFMTMVDAEGKNSGCVCEGANRALCKEELQCAAVEQLISSADVCLIDGGCGTDVVKSAVRIANAYKTKVILEAQVKFGHADTIDDPDWPMEYYSVDILVPKFQQQEECSGINAAAGIAHKIKLAGSELVARGVECVVVGNGTKGSYVIDRNGTIQVCGFDRECGGHHSICDDAFAGALAASCGAGDEPQKAVKFAEAARSISAGRIGEQDILPSKEEIIQLLINYPD